MFLMQLARKSWLKFLAWSTFATLFAFSSESGVAQTVQLPVVGTFSLNTSVLAPDSGSAFLGGNRRMAIGSQSLGPGSTASGMSRSAASATAHATIIDLNELDLMIRSQSGNKPTTPDLYSYQSKPSKYATGSKGKPAQNAEYEYLAALTHEENAGPSQISSDTSYYLSLANNAKQHRHWAAVELYYKLAWQSLPESRRESVLKSLEDSRIKIAQEKTKTSSK